MWRYEVFMLAKSNEDEVFEDRTILMHLKGNISYEIGIGKPVDLEPPNVDSEWVTGVRFVFKINTSNHLDHEFYKSSKMPLKDVEELQLTHFGPGSDLKTINTIPDDELRNKFHLALRDYVLSMIDDKMGLT